MPCGFLQNRGRGGLGASAPTYAGGEGFTTRKVGQAEPEVGKKTKSSDPEDNNTPPTKKNSRKKRGG